MNAMLYLIRKEIKNSLLDMIRHPGKLILYLFLIALLLYTFFTQAKSQPQVDHLDFRILHGIYLGIMFLIGLPVIFTGLKSGATFFRMSDVNYLFVSPISPRKILAYGLVKQMGSSLLAVFFLLFYSGMASEAFGIVPWQMVALVFGIALLLFTTQLITLLIYGFVSGNPSRVKKVQACLYVLVGLAALFVIEKALTGGSPLEDLLAAVASPILTFLPVFGWVKGLVFAILEGGSTEIILYTVLNVIALGGSLLLFLRSNPDYYEDVLQSTESTYEVQKAVKEGRSLQKNNLPAAKVRVGQTGIGHGWGANTFFYKHLLQHRRKSRLLFFSASTVVLTVIAVVMGVFLQHVTGDNSDRMPSGMIMGICLALCCYILFFFNMAGDWSMELMKPYIYLVPEKPFQKLVWASISTVLKPAMDSVVIFTVLAVFLKANPATAVICMLLYTSVGFIYVSSNVLFERLFGQMANKGLIMLFYILLLMVLLAPGVVISAVLYFNFSSLPGLIVGLPDVIWNIGVSLGIFAACRNMLSTVEYNL